MLDEEGKPTGERRTVDSDQGLRETTLEGLAGLRSASLPKAAVASAAVDRARYPIATLTPQAARSLAVAAPIPREPPVMRARLPARSDNGVVSAIAADYSVG